MHRLIVLSLLTLFASSAVKPAAAQDLWHAFRAHEYLDRLLADERWEHPAEVLDAEGELEPYFRELIEVARARAERVDEPSQLLAVRQKLEAAWTEEQARTTLVRDFASRLAGYERQVSEQLLRRAATEYRLRQARRRSKD